MPWEPPATFINEPPCLAPNDSARLVDLYRPRSGPGAGQLVAGTPGPSARRERAGPDPVLGFTRGARRSMSTGEAGASDPERAAVRRGMEGEAIAIDPRAQRS